jgi:O-antigen/teichoic acid export membrane protein
MSNSGQISRDVQRGLGWVGLASTLVSLLDMIAIVLILTFWISKEEYGIATMATWCFPVLDLATDLGLSAAVIQRDDHTEDRISTVFWLNLAMSLLLFVGLVGLSGMVASFLGHAVIGSMLIVYGTKLIWQNVYFIPYSMMRRELRYRELSLLRVGANGAEFVGKVGSAALGMGVWCFVIGPLCRVVVTGIGTQIVHPWRPRWVLRLSDAIAYVTFGLKQSFGQMLFHLYTNLDYPIVGYFFGEGALGVYKFAYDIVLDPVRIISKVVVDVAFPAFARLKSSAAELIEQFIWFTRVNLVTTLAFVAVVFVTADDLLEVLFDERFAASGPAIRILCSVGILRALSHLGPPLLDGMGHPGRTLVYQAVAAIVLPSLFVAAAMLLGDQLGFLSVAWAWTVGYPVAFGTLWAIVLAALNLSPVAYVRRIMGVPLCAVVAAAAGLTVRSGLLHQPAGLRLMVAGSVVVAVLGLLLAYLQDISPRSIIRALKR